MKAAELIVAFDGLVAEVEFGLDVGPEGKPPHTAAQRSFVMGRYDDPSTKLKDDDLFNRLRTAMLRFRKERPVSKSIYWIEKPQRRVEKAAVNGRDTVEFRACFALSDTGWDYRA